MRVKEGTLLKSFFFFNKLSKTNPRRREVLTAQHGQKQWGIGQLRKKKNAVSCCQLVQKHEHRILQAPFLRDEQSNPENTHFK